MVVWTISTCSTRKHDVVAAGEVGIDDCRYALRTTVMLEIPTIMLVNNSHNVPVCEFKTVNK